MSHYQKRQDRKRWKAERRSVMFMLKRVLPQSRSEDPLVVAGEVRAHVENLESQARQLSLDAYRLKRLLGEAEHIRAVQFGGLPRFGSVQAWEAPVAPTPAVPRVELRQFAYAHVCAREERAWLQDPAFIERQIHERAARAFVREFLTHGFLQPVRHEDPRDGSSHFSWALWIGRGIPVRGELAREHA
jgi:hypothetical protein